VTTADKATIEAARAAYDALTADQKAYVSSETLAKLTAAEDALKAAEAGDKINALPAAASVTSSNKEAIEAARAAYDALTADQKAYVSPEMLQKLKDAEDMLVVLQAESEISAKTGSDVTFNGSPLPLINAPTTGLPEGYKMVYALASGSSAPDSSAYSDAIPETANAGTYTVYYKAVKGDTQLDYTEGSVEVTVARAALTITAKDQSIYVGNNIPAWTSDSYTVTGLIGDDTLDTEPSVKYELDGNEVTPDSSSARTYVIVPYGAVDPNYDITYVNGSLKVEFFPAAETFAPGIVPSEGGSVTTSPANPAAGDTVTVTVTPEEGFELDTLTVTNAAGNPITLTKNADGTYSFVQPAGGSASISASFKAAEEGSGSGDGTSAADTYTDVDADDWFADAVDYVTEKGYMEGITETVFAPNTGMTRAMFAQLIYNMAGKPEFEGAAEFSDVDAGSEYAKAIAWADEKGFMMGFGNGIFKPDTVISREQMTVVLYRYMKSLGYGFEGTWTFPLQFADADQVSDWAYEAMCWFTMNGVVQGKSNNMLDPQGLAKRAEAAKVVMGAEALEN